MKRWWLTLVLALCGCVSLGPQAREVVVTENTADVATCKLMGDVSTSAPYFVQSEGIKQLRNLTARQDGDTLLLTTTDWSRGSVGKAYRCKPVVKSGK